MKRTVTIICRIIGTLSFLLCVLFFIGRSLPDDSYPGMAKRDFGTPEAVLALSKFYERIEQDSGKSGLVPVDRDKVMDTWIPVENIASIRMIPSSELPQHFGIVWGGNDPTHWGVVLAYYDQQDRLEGIEFVGSRYGAYLSRKIPPCPNWFNMLYRYSTEPISIIGRVNHHD